MGTFNVDEVLPETDKVNFSTIEFDVKNLALIFNRFINEGSRVHRLAVGDLTVYANPKGEFTDIEKDATYEVELTDKAKTKLTVAKTLKGLMACGTKFLDAIVWLGLESKDRPMPMMHPMMKNEDKTAAYSTYNNPSKLANYMFYYYFYLLTRAHPPGIASSGSNEPVPKFLSGVLGIRDAPSEVADYLASFELQKINPAWIRHIDKSGLSQESLSRFGLGVAGYRAFAPFALYKPWFETKEGELWLEKNEKELKEGKVEDPRIYKTAYEVAKSFAVAPADWDIHPCTRNPNVLKKYGNLNQNMGNLMLKVFSTEQLAEMVSARLIYAKPVYRAEHQGYKNWTDSYKFSGSKPIF